MAKKEAQKVNEEQVTPAAATLHTKSAMMAGILAAMSSMTHEDMMKWFPDAMALSAPAGDHAAQNAASIQMRVPANPMAEDVTRLFEGSDLSEETKTKITTLVEHAVELQVGIAREQLNEEFQEKLLEETIRIQDQLVDKIDGFATLAAEEWIEKNQVAIESTIKIERADKILEGVMELVKACGFEVPADQVDAVAELQTENAKLRAKLDEHVESEVAARQEAVAARALSIFGDVCEGLTAIQTDKFKKLVEDMEVDIDPDDLKKKLTIIREAHFKDAAQSNKSAVQGLTEAIVDGQVEPGTETIKEEKPITDARIKAYAEAIDRGSGRYVRGPYAR